MIVFICIFSILVYTYIVIDSEQKTTELQAALFGTLADPTRLKLIKLLCRQQPHALCVNALAGILGVSQSAVSQHLRLLKSIGLVRGERRGYHIHYYVNADVIKGYRDLVLNVFTIEETLPGQPCQNNCLKREDA